MNATHRFIFCDGCNENNGGDDRGDYPNFYFMRKARLAMGWKVIKGKDYCPECLKKPKEIRGTETEGV